jgi:glycosyltransferase involved in cell wall biosynthesis
MAEPRAALVHDHFVGPGGAEQVVLELARILSAAELFTTFVDPPDPTELAGRRVHTWPLQGLAAARRRYRAFLPLYPLRFERLDLRRFDLVVSSSSSFSKAVRTRSDAPHIAYIHTPMRYAWDLETYLRHSSISMPGRLGARMLRPVLRRWDRRTASRPDILIANSTAVRDRIRRYWNLDAEVIPPPVRLEDLSLSTRDDGYLLIVSRLLAYRRIDLLVSAASRLGRELVIVGEGPELRSLLALAGSSVKFVGRIERSGVAAYLENCHAYVVPGAEDFGIAPVEAMAAGKPVIAFRAGGALDTVIEGKTGVFFDRQTPGALADAITQLDATSFDGAAIRANAERFTPDVFRERFLALFERLGVDRHLYGAGAETG